MSERLTDEDLDLLVWLSSEEIQVKHSIEPEPADLTDDQTESDGGEEPSASEDAYNFPAPFPITGDAATIISRMNDATVLMKEQRLNRENFQRARADYCSLAAELNMRGSIAPAYRPRLSPPARFKRRWTDDLHANDLQVLDVHWLYCCNPQRGNVTKTTADLFTGDQFDFDAAARFASLPWKLDKKVKALRLVPEEAWEMALIYPSENRHLRKKLLQDCRCIDDAVKRGQRRKPSLRACSEWGRIWMARRIVELVDGPGAATPTLVAHAYARMTGIAKERRTLGKQMKRIEHFLHDRGMASMASAPASVKAVGKAHAATEI